MKTVIRGIPGLDGEYELTLDLTLRELSQIKKLSGIRAGEINEALQAGDSDLFVALTVISLQRAGKQFDPESIWDATDANLDIVIDEPEGDAVPPESAPDSNENSVGPTESSSTSSNESSEPSLAA